MSSDGRGASVGRIVSEKTGPVGASWGSSPGPRGCGSIRVSTAWQPPVVECREPGSGSAQRGSPRQPRALGAAWPSGSAQLGPCYNPLWPSCLPSSGGIKSSTASDKAAWGPSFWRRKLMFERQIAIKLLRDDNEELASASPARRAPSPNSVAAISSRSSTSASRGNRSSRWGSSGVRRWAI